MTKKITTKAKTKPKSVAGFETQNYPSLADYKKVLQDIFVSPSTCWSTLSVRAAIDNHDLGNFQGTGRLVDSMLRDPRIFGCCNTLVYGILGLPFEWKFPEDYKPTEEDKQYLEVLDKWWKEFVATSVPATLMKTVINMGLSIFSKSWNLQYLEGYEDQKFYIPEVHVFHPSNVFYNPGIKQYFVITLSHGVIEVPSKDERLQLVKHVDSERPWMNGAVRSLGLPWLSKVGALGDWNAYLTVNGNPLRILTTDRPFSTPPENDIEDFIQNLAMSYQFGSPLHLMQGQTLELLQANTANADLFKGKVDQVDTEIAIVYLGQNLTTEVKGGSLAAANVHDSVKQDYIEAYTTTLNRALYTIVSEFYKFNFPEGVVIPQPFFNPEIPVNEEQIQVIKGQKAEAFKQVAEGLKSLSETLVDGKSPLSGIDIKKLLEFYME